ncbi:long-chain-fatty-acid--CoA ligase [Nocardia jiangxiensis]|uniref:Long-chain-fatty-acid--CoA ligase n=1 Tax=Nocardia jiangxiensis TaxID=282685 RepID=A0ABW6SAQ9_9NOCA
MTVAGIAERAEACFGHNAVSERTSDGVRVSTYAETVGRARRLGSALVEMGVKPGDRVATFGWNSTRHFELYLAVPGIGAVLHTLNIRLHENDLTYIAQHAGDTVVFVDAGLASSLPHLPGVRLEVIMNGDDLSRPGALGYEELLATGDPDYRFPEVDENAAAAMCYTSGTTGRPKGVLYSQRSIALYSLMANQPDAFGIAESDAVLPVVPMFHANAWGLPYIAAMSGARLVLPGPSPTARDLADLIAAEHVSVAAAVPTIWQAVHALEEPVDLSSLREAICGGAPVPESLIRRFDDRFGVPIVQGWGMTETSPLALISRPAAQPGRSIDQTYSLRATQGRPLAFVGARIAGGERELQVSGPTVASSYYDRDSTDSFTDDKWLRTGDVAELVEGQYFRLLDRTKDLVKSGGEWISSVALESAVLFHPDVADAAVVAIADERWGERPCMFIVTEDRARLDKQAVLEFLRPKFESWWMPDRIEFVAEIPKTSVGKIDKVALRGRAAQLAQPDSAQ